MSATQHTPGPWTITAKRWDGDDLFDINGPQRHVTVVHNENAEDVANARLIAAAPAMLDSLDAILAWFDGDYLPETPEDRLLAEARYVVDKAKGFAA